MLDPWALIGSDALARWNQTSVHAVDVKAPSVARWPDGPASAHHQFVGCPTIAVQAGDAENRRLVPTEKGRPVKSLTELIRQASDDVPGARDELFAAAYGELRRLAHSRLRDGGRNTYLDTTAVVHECYLRFVDRGQLRPSDRRAFFAYASAVMRSVIVDAVRQRQAERRGGDLEQLTLDSGIADQLDDGRMEVIKVHDALLALEQEAPRQAKIIEMRYFGGYSVEEVAVALDLTERTVHRDWTLARLALKGALSA